MTPHRLKAIRYGFALLATGSALMAVPAVAQTVQSGSYAEDPGAALTRHLQSLAAQPRSLGALTGAGKAALALGDAQAALTFFARAEEIAPRDGRVKAGMGSAFLHMEKPREAMKFFDEARSLGVPEAEFAGDRGLVYDLSGDPVRAQADYLLALRRQEDAEVRRRLALSLAISGNQQKALETIDLQLRQQDRSAWRVRAFILALTGDTTEAARAVESAMPWQAAQMRPFLARLPSLSPAQRAMAVHFGNMPADGQPIRVADATPYSTPVQPPAAAAQSSSTSAAAPLRQRTTVPAPVSTAPRRRPDETQRVSEAQRPRSTAGRISGFDLARGNEPRRSAPSAVRPMQVAEARPNLTAQVSTPSQAAAAATPPPASDVAALPSTASGNGSVTAPASAPAPTTQIPATQTVTEASGAAQPGISGWTLQSVPSATIVATDLPPSVVSPDAPAQAPAPTVAASVQPVASAPAAAPPPAGEAPAEPPAVTTRASGFASVAALVADLPGAEPTASGPAAVTEPAEPAAQRLESAPFKRAVPAGEARQPPSGKADAPKPAPKPAAAKVQPEKVKTAEAPAKAPAKKAEPAKPKEPSRIWVQIAGGADKKALPREYSRLKTKAPKLLAGKAAWTTPLRATNRLLVGPFKTQKEAQDLVNELNKLDFSAFSWTSPAGQEIEKLAAQ